MNMYKNTRLTPYHREDIWRLYNKVKITTKSGLIFEGTPISTKESIVGEDEFPKGASWWRIKPVGNKFIFSCISGAQGSRECKTEITKDEFNKLRTCEITAKDICYKYNIG